MQRLLYFFNICLSICLLLSYLSPWINPEYLSLISLFGLLFPVWLASNLLFAIYWLLKKPKFSILSIVSILLGWNAIGGLVQFNSADPVLQDGDLQIMSYNVRGIRLSPKDKKNVAAMAEYFDDKKNIDILCIQEKRNAKKSIINSFFPEMETIESEFGMAIFSKYPIINKGKLKVGGNTEEAVWADIKHSNGKTFRVYSYHLSSNLITKTTDAIMKDPDLREAKTWSRVKGILKNYSKYTVMRKRQLDILMAHVRKSPHPVILAGDMNDVPQSYVNRLIRKKRQDTFREEGSGLGVSFGGKYPFLRIDYIIPNQQFIVLNHQVDQVKFSDHYPIFANLDFK